MLLKELIEKLLKISSQNPECLDKEVYVEGDCLPSELMEIKFGKTDNMLHLIINEKKWPWMFTEKELQREIELEKANIISAKRILDEIPNKVLAAKKAGDNFIIVMDVGYPYYENDDENDGDENNNSSKVIKPEWFDDKTIKFVYYGCIDLGLIPTIESGIEGDCEYNLIVRW